MGLLGPINPLGESGIDVLVCGAVCSRPPDAARLRTPGRPPCTVVVDREDDVRFTRTALASHDAKARRFVVHPTVAATDRLLWHDILQALGTRQGAAPGAQEAQERAVHTALKTGGRGQLTILRAHRIGLGLWADLIHLHRTTRTNLVLVHHADLPGDIVHLLGHSHHRIIDTLAGMAELHPPAAAAGHT